MRSIQKSADAYLPLEEFVKIPLLVKIRWTKNTMAAMIRGEMLRGEFENSTKCYFTSWNSIVAALEIRNKIVLSKLIDMNNDLPKWGENGIEK